MMAMERYASLGAAIVDCFRCFVRELTERNFTSHVPRKVN